MFTSALAIGSGGREFSVVRELLNTRGVGKVVFAPGNGGFNDFYRRYVKADDITGIVTLAQNEQTDFVFVGPEAPLVAGLVDQLDAAGIKAFGPSKAAAQLEGSKKFAKDRLMEIGGHTPEYACATTYKDAEKIIRSWGAPIVVKADGLCAGKGVKVAMNLEDALAAAHNCLVKDIFKEAGRIIVIERYTPGREFSLHCLCDGVNALPLPVVRDYKRALDGDEGDNTGGMGAYSPVPDIKGYHVRFVVEQIVKPLLRLMEKRGTPFHGCLYVGGVIDLDGAIKIYEFNVRFGDPETQVILALHASGLPEALYACCFHGGLVRVPPPTFSYDAAVNVVMAAYGYPNNPRLGDRILGLDTCGPVCHAGTRRENGMFFVSGGRILNVVRTGRTHAEARAKAYEALSHITGGWYRTDIAAGL